MEVSQQQWGTIKYLTFAQDSLWMNIQNTVGKIRCAPAYYSRANWYYNGYVDEDKNHAVWTFSNTPQWADVNYSWGNPRFEYSRSIPARSDHRAANFIEDAYCRAPIPFGYNAAGVETLWTWDSGLGRYRWMTRIHSPGYTAP